MGRTWETERTADVRLAFSHGRFLHDETMSLNREPEGYLDEELDIDEQPSLQPPTPTTTPHWRRGFQGRPSTRARDGFAASRSFVQARAEMLGRTVADFNKNRSTGEKVKFVLGWIGAIILGFSLLALYGEAFHRIIAWAQKLRDVNHGWLILWFLTVIVSFPPLIGYGTFVTISGVIYGIWRGWLIAASSTVVGSAISFVVCRTVYSDWVKRKTANDKRFTAFALVLQHDGLKLLCMIRLCPLPYSFSNGAIATVPTVTWGKFVAATALVTPKILFGVFIGSRLAVVADGKGEMQTWETAVNYISIFFTLGIAVATGWFVYRRTMARSKQLETQEGGQQHPAPVGEVLRGSYSDDVDDELDELDEYGATELDMGELDLEEGPKESYRD